MRKQDRLGLDIPGDDVCRVSNVSPSQREMDIIMEQIANDWGPLGDDMIDAVKEDSNPFQYMHDEMTSDD